MDGPSLWIGIHVLSLAGINAVVLFSSHKVHKLARELRLPWPLSALEVFPVAEVLIMIYGLSFYSWSDALGFATGASLSNMIVASAIAIEQARPNGFATFPMYVAAGLCFVPVSFVPVSFVPVSFGARTAIATRRSSELLVLMTIAFLLLISYAVAIPLVRTRAKILGQHVDEAHCAEQDTAYRIAAAAPSAGQPEISTPSGAASVGDRATEPIKYGPNRGQRPVPDRDMETQSLLPTRSELDPGSINESRPSPSFLLALTALLFSGAITIFAIHRLAIRSRVGDGQIATLAGIVLAGCPSAPVMRALVLGLHEEDLNMLRSRCSNNLILLVVRLGIVGLRFSQRSILDAVYLIGLPALATLFAVAGHHFRGYWWFLGIPVLVANIAFLCFYTLLALGFPSGPRDDGDIIIGNEAT
ncbi:hypothetical protein Slin15195_G063710 [Septoria linicola]|uniref:Uncharacterized protein n=1 Tax=Septoria linicola TaxID=215465 RepID=A0A9Q9AW53_9PEZI|nr:hypothetical protein Slin14017_G114020 [Septoria linicola]USW53052.1 hypothetical protein Slin15195_G063710 [Septoria linicola]